jgi:hypothetical protein
VQDVEGMNDAQSGHYRSREDRVHGRGSSGGSLVAFLLGITRIDPILLNFPFERFLTAERAGKTKIILLTKEDGSQVELREEQEVEVIRDGKKIKIQAKNIEENDDLIET